MQCVSNIHATHTIHKPILHCTCTVYIIANTHFLFQAKLNSHVESLQENVRKVRKTWFKLHIHIYLQCISYMYSVYQVHVVMDIA